MSPSPFPLRRCAAAGTTTLALAAAVLAAPAAAHAEPSSGELVIDAPATVTAGDDIEIAVRAPGADDLFAYDLVVSASPELALAADGVLPAGGFDAIRADADGVSLAHTRLGTSPALAGDVVLATLPASAVDEGSAEIRIDAVTAVGADGSTADLGSASVVVEVLAADAGEDAADTGADEGAADDAGAEDAEAGAEDSGDGSAADGSETDADGETGSDAPGGGEGGTADDADDGLAPTGGSLATLGIAAALVAAAGIGAGTWMLRRRREGSA
ncbi:hypothetical protein [Microbacterium sp. gxy059]|uniref:hypothetical protein n=1 Tax=Microbacterium sp. gxy059 TaxID=2957199 RepID=UPI003D970CA5